MTNNIDLFNIKNAEFDFKLFIDLQRPIIDIIWRAFIDIDNDNNPYVYAGLLTDNDLKDLYNKLKEYYNEEKL